MLLFMMALFLSSCKVSQQTVVEKVRLASTTYSKEDSAFFMGNLLSDTIGDNFGLGGFGLSGTGYGGGGSGVGTIGISSTGLGYGSINKKQNTADAKASKKAESKGIETVQKKSASPNVKTDNNTLAGLSQVKANDQAKADKLIAFRDSPNRQSSDESGSKVKQEIYLAGKHPKEMPTGSYAVAEIFDSENAANLYASRLVRLGFDPNVPRFVTATNKWYVCLDGPNKPAKTRDKIAELGKLQIFKDVWQLIIN